MKSASYLSHWEQPNVNVCKVLTHNHTGIQAPSPVWGRPWASASSDSRTVTGASGVGVPSRHPSAPTGLRAWCSNSQVLTPATGSPVLIAIFAAARQACNAGHRCLLVCLPPFQVEGPSHAPRPLTPASTPVLWWSAPPCILSPACKPRASFLSWLGYQTERVQAKNLHPSLPHSGPPGERASCTPPAGRCSALRLEATLPVLLTVPQPVSRLAQRVMSCASPTRKHLVSAQWLSLLALASCCWVL